MSDTEYTECPVCGRDASHHPVHAEGEYECYTDDCWIGSFYPDRRPEAEGDADE